MDIEHFLQAAFSGNVRKVQTGLRRGIDVNINAKNGMSLLMISIWHHANLPMVRYLLQMGADMRYRQPSTGWNALTYAALNGHPEVLQCLFDHGAQLDEPGGDWQALMYSVKYGNTACAEVLLQNGAKINTRDYRNQSPLMRAARMANYEMVQLLLQYGADPNLQDNLGMTALMYAVACDHLPLTEAILSAGADRLYTNSHGQTAKDIALEKSTNELMQILND